MNDNTALQTVEEPATQTKRCSRCGVEKPLQEFYRYKNSATNKIFSRCKECTRITSVERSAGLKRCSACRQVKRREEFYVYQSRDDSSKAILSSVCMECIRVAREGIGSQTKICSRCGIRKPLYEFYGNASRPDGRTRSCKTCWNGRMGSYPEDTLGDHVEEQIVSIVRELAELENELNEAESSAGVLKGRQDVLKNELARICNILRTDTEPVQRQCDYGRIKYDDAGLSVTLEPEMAVTNRGEY